MKKLSLLSIIIFLSTTIISAENGKKVFETYCWGCHHQPAVAFGPPFSEIASKRDEATIRAMITDPKSVSKVLGYSRNAMPAFTLKETELQSITAYILSYKENNAIKGKK
jgi:mono/diheme cytochrome c family protein